MKHSQTIGFVLSLLIIGICFLPWSFYTTLHFSATGLNAQQLGYGKPGLLNIFFSLVAALFFIIPNVTIKRINLFIAALNIAWAIRNYVLLNTCSGGDCPKLQYGMYLLILVSAGILLMSMLPTYRTKFGEE
ncbi:hypothetical protein [Rhizosphaericola mali]|uniref:DUF4293 family protein n=1 Tax=Rhizosphaericola mali TaxID=2545455 RepID=A0A5P2FZ61_9BACT|nr:hypothetical protein [Rhizosphaericola mali]QES88227.1 hypothetical protein E0W69_005940 [Rhizosphaericola mali]